MPFPKLRYVDRHATKGKKHYFQCTRSKEHPPEHPKVRASFPTKKDFDSYVTRHDATFHDQGLARHLGIRRSPRLIALVTTFLERMDARWRAGEADPKTLTFYKDVSRKLLKHLGEETETDAIDSAMIMRYVDARRAEPAQKGNIQTSGSRIRKEVSALGTIFRDSGEPIRWALRRDAIKAAKKPRPDIGVETIRMFIAAMNPKSIEWKFCVVKFSTAMRNEELFAANVGDVDLSERALVYRLRNKRGERKEHAAYLNDVAAGALASLVKRRRADAPLFTLEGRRLQKTSLRVRLRHASERATAELRKKNPKASAIEIEAVGMFRREAGSAVMEELQSTYAVTEHFAHTTEGTTRKHYKVTRRAEVLGHSRKFGEITGEILSPQTRK